MIEVVSVGIYILCSVASFACAWLLLRGYGRNRTRLLFWAGLCFSFLFLNNLAVLLDLLVFADFNLQGVRHGASLAAVGTLLVGLVWEAE